MYWPIYLCTFYTRILSYVCQKIILEISFRNISIKDYENLKAKNIIIMTLVH